SAQRDPYGAWIEVTYVATPSTGRAQIAGEFIAVHRDTVFVLPMTNALAEIPIEQIRRARLAHYASQWELLALWTVGGAVSTVSHGLLLILSAPTWIVVGSIASAVHSHAPIERINAGDWPTWVLAARMAPKWREMRRFARFPQGLPEGVDRAGLQPKRRR
ncbi:MAG: hypothetical protein PVF27_07530, partial [Gemmatimonadales bacterium]